MTRISFQDREALTTKRGRGYQFLPDSVARTIPAINATEGQMEDAIARVHYFSGGSDWFVTEYDPETGEAYGWAELVSGGGEFGYLHLPELARVRVFGILPVDRDLDWEPMTVGAAIERRKRSLGL